MPEDFDAGRDQIGTISATGTENSTSVNANTKIYLEAENNLIIKDLEVVVNGEDENMDDGDDIEVYPAAEIEMIIELKNTHSDMDIEDIEVTVVGEDDLDDIDEDENRMGSSSSNQYSQGSFSHPEVDSSPWFAWGSFRPTG